MRNLTNANLQRQNKALDKLYSFNTGISTYRKLIKESTFKKGTISIVQKHKYNRVNLTVWTGMSN